jgi:hypothetical protein
MSHVDDRTKQVEEWLDGALKRYSHAEPHPALESRILANLLEKRERTVSKWFWGTALAVAAAVLFVVLVAGLMQRKDRGREVVQVEPRGSGSLSTGTTKGSSARREKSASTSHAAGVGRSSAAQVARPEVGTKVVSKTAGSEVKGPRLAQFPSSRPDSEQARLLAAYLENAPAGEVVTVVVATNSIQDLTVPDLSVAPLGRPAENSKEEK